VFFTASVIVIYFENVSMKLCCVYIKLLPFWKLYKYIKNIFHLYDAIYWKQDRFCLMKIISTLMKSGCVADLWEIYDSQIPHAVITSQLWEFKLWSNSAMIIHVNVVNIANYICKLSYIRACLKIKVISQMCTLIFCNIWLMKYYLAQNTP
jgi:hypothetical protein